MVRPFSRLVTSAAADGQPQRPLHCLPQVAADCAAGEPDALAQIASFSALAARNATFLLALIFTASPVAGLRPMRAGRLRTSRMPSAPKRIRSPRFRCAVTRSTTSSSRIIAARRGRSCSSAICSAKFFGVTTEAADAFLGTAAAFCADFAGAEAFAAVFLPAAGAADLADFFAGAGLDAMVMTYASVLIFIGRMGARANSLPLAHLIHGLGQNWQ